MRYDPDDPWGDKRRLYPELYESKAHAKKMSEREAKRRQYRTVEYVAPGHTRVNYHHRVLDIRFKESQAHFDHKTGRDAESRGRARAEKGQRAITAAKLKRDKYTLEDMRALLRDDHWEEVCGNKRWNYDGKATVREFNKYLKRKH